MDGFTAGEHLHESLDPSRPRVAARRASGKSVRPRRTSPAARWTAPSSIASWSASAEAKAGESPSTVSTASHACSSAATRRSASWWPTAASSPARAFDFTMPQGRLFLQLSLGMPHSSPTHPTKRSTASTPALNTSASNTANSDNTKPSSHVHYGIHQGDLIALTRQHRPFRAPRIENDTLGEITVLHPNGSASIALDGSDRHHRRPRRPPVHPPRLRSTRLLPAERDRRARHRPHQRLANQQETAYVEATRARQRTYWHIAAKTSTQRPRARPHRAPRPTHDRQPSTRPDYSTAGTTVPYVGRRLQP